MLTELGRTVGGTDTHPLVQESETSAVELTKQQVESALRALEGFDSGEHNLGARSLAILMRHSWALEQLTILEGSSLRSDEGTKGNDFLGRCDEFSEIVSIALSTSGFRPKTRRTIVHTFLKVDSDGEDVYIDPTMGQFVGGHSQIFVGTEANLTDLISQAYEDRRLVNLSTYFRADMASGNPPIPLVMINRLWRIGGMISWAQYRRLDLASRFPCLAPTAGSNISASIFE